MSVTPWHKKLIGGFKRTSERLTENLTGLVTKSKLDSETLDGIEEALITSDLGPATAAASNCSPLAQACANMAETGSI